MPSPGPRTRPPTRCAERSASSWSAAATPTTRAATSRSTTGSGGHRTPADASADLANRTARSLGCSHAAAAAAGGEGSVAERRGVLADQPWLRAWLVTGLAAWALLGVLLVTRADSQGLVDNISISPY